MTIEEYLQSLTGQRLTLEQLRALSQGGLLSGGDFMGRTVGDVVGGGPRSQEEWLAQAYQQPDPNGAPTLREGWSLDAAGNPQKALTAADVQAQNLQLIAGDYGPSGAYGAQNYGLTANDDGTYTLGDGSFQDFGGNHQIGGTFFDRYAPLIAGGLITGGAMGLFGAGGAPAAGALGMGADGMGAMSLGASGTGAAGATGAASFMDTGLSGAELGGSLEQQLAGELAAGGASSGSSWLQSLGSGLGSLASAVPANAWAPLIGAGVGALAGGQDSTTTNSTQVDPALAAYMQQYRDLAAQTSAIPFEGYTDPRVAGLTDAQRAAGGALQGQVDNIPALREQIGGLVGQGTTNLSAAQNTEMDQIRAMLGDLTQARTATANPYADMNNPYLQGAIAASNRGLADSYNTLVAPKYSQGSSFGNSGLAEYEALDRANLARQMSDNSNTLSYQGFNLGAQLAESGASRQDAINNLLSQLGLQGAQVLGQLGESQAGRADQMATGNATRSLQGAQILGNSEQQYAALINNLLGYGNQEQATNQAGLDAQYEEFMRRIGYPAQQLGIFGQGLAANPGSTSTSTTPGNTWTGAAGGALLGAQVQRLLNQPAGSTQQQVIRSPQMSTMSGSLDLTNPKKLFGQTVVGQ